MKYFEFDHNQTSKYATPLEAYRSWRRGNNPPKDGDEIEILEINALKVRYRYQNGEMVKVSEQDGVFYGDGKR